MEKPWDKVERRKNPDGTRYCEGHWETVQAISLVKNDLGHLVEAVTKIDKHMEEASKNRVNWWIAIAGVMVTVIIQTCIFAFFLGSVAKQVDVNTGKLHDIEGVVYHTNKGNIN